MKIRPSLKLYFIAMMVISGITTISIMSVVSVSYFLSGIDSSMHHTMRAQAYMHKVSDGQPIKINDLVIASQWNDLPSIIRENLNEQDLVENELLKFIDGSPLFSPPKAGYFAIKLNRHGQTRYVSSMFITEHKKAPPNDHAPLLSSIMTIALIVMVLFSLFPYFILRKVTHPVEDLMNWARQLNKKKLTEPTPDFHYSELNNLARIVQSSLQSVQESLQREQQFLGYASHELRTPIAVTRTNAELLKKMIEKNINHEKQLQVLERIERASLTMTDLTETLLWLNRQQDKSIPIKPVAIGSLAQQLVEELAYLNKDKQVDITIETDASEHLLPKALCRIAISNLIRNALQHTHQGHVTIKQSNTCLIITNHDITKDKIKEELGFGLGLALTERLVQHYGWQYKNLNANGGHYVEINFVMETEGNK